MSILNLFSPNVCRQPLIHKYIIGILHELSCLEAVGLNHVTFDIVVWPVRRLLRLSIFCGFLVLRKFSLSKKVYVGCDIRLSVYPTRQL